MQPKIFAADKHEIDPAHIDADALMVLKRLTQAGHVAYLVGGGVRDLLVKKHPKDFDISTSASPEEIKKLFSRQCLLIGRRFRLAHVRFGQKVIEVSTFRSGESGDDLIVRDNEWGTPEEDSLRRDFTINGLFLDPTHHQVIDYVGGWEDIHRGILRTIGDPTVRFKQDPVRMIRLLKFVARFGFTIDTETLKALQHCKREILKASPARVLEELMRMLESGASKAFFELMLAHGLLEPILPWLAQFLKSSSKDQLYGLLECADALTKAEAKPLDRAVLSACLLFPILERELKLQFTDKDAPIHLHDVSVLTHALIRGVAGNSFPPFTKRHKGAWSFILSTQYRLTPVDGKIQPRTKLLRHYEFPLALTVLRLRAAQNPKLQPFLEEWALLYSKQPPLTKAELAEAEEERSPQRRRRSRYRNSPHHRHHGH